MTFIIDHIEFETGDIVQKYDNDIHRWNYWSTIQNRDDAIEAVRLVDQDSNYRVVRGAEQAVILME